MQLHCVEKYHSDDDLSSVSHNGSRAIINVLIVLREQSEPFHTLDKPCDSSSWLSQVPSFRQETCQAYYRNDPVKYDLSVSSACSVTKTSRKKDKTDQLII